MTRGTDQVEDQVADFGVDTGLIDANLRLSVEDRMRRHFERVRMYQRMQARTLSEGERASLRKAQVEEAIRRWGTAVPQ